MTKKINRQKIKDGIDLIKYLHKNEYNSDLKGRLADLGSILNQIMIGSGEVIEIRKT